MKQTKAKLLWLQREQPKDVGSWEACLLGFPLLPPDGPCSDTDSRAKVTALSGQHMPFQL